MPSDETAQDVERWPEEECWGDWESRARAAEALVDRLETRVGKLEEALRFYADPESYRDGAPGEWITETGHPGSYDGFSHDEFEHDNGERARAALATPRRKREYQVANVLSPAFNIPCGTDRGKAEALAAERPDLHHVESRLVGEWEPVQEARDRG